MDILLERLIEPLAEPSRILDLGAGDGDQAKALAGLGHSLVAVDRRAAPFARPDIEWATSDIPAWLASYDGGLFDGALLRHVIQFFDPDTVARTVIPEVRELIRPGGVVAVETFTRPPEPPFSKPHPSHWRVDDLRALFPGWDILLADEADERRRGLDGVERLFHVARLVARKP